MARAYCPDCLRPQVTCLCELAAVVDLPWPLIVLQHPAEVGQAKGSVPLLKACVPATQVWVGEDFSAHAGLNHYLESDKYQCLLVYPGAEARPASAWQQDSLGRQPCFVLLDATWRKSVSLLHSHPALMHLPRLALPEQTSRYRIRKSPHPAGLSTLEAAVAALSAWSESPALFSPVLQAFDRWVTREVARLPQPIQSRYR